MAVQGSLVKIRCLIRSLQAMQFDVSEQQGHKRPPTEHGIADLIVVGLVLRFQLLQ